MVPGTPRLPQQKVGWGTAPQISQIERASAYKSVAKNNNTRNVEPVHLHVGAPETPSYMTLPLLQRLSAIPQSMFK